MSRATLTRPPTFDSYCSRDVKIKAAGEGEGEGELDADFTAFFAPSMTWD